jgi:hypothetical protein
MFFFSASYDLIFFTVKLECRQHSGGVVCLREREGRRERARERERERTRERERERASERERARAREREVEEY